MFINKTKFLSLSELKRNAWFRGFLLSLLTLVAVRFPSVAQISPVEEQPVVSLITFFPGSEIYELEGHAALRIRTSTSDIAYNWGLFDFNAPGFVYRFVKGETDYSVGEAPWSIVEEEYIAQGRRIEEQILNLNTEQIERLIQLVNENLKPENRVYRYNYVKDNCATRILHLIDQAVNDSIALAPPSALETEGKAEWSFRDVMAFYHTRYPWYQFGIDLALGSGIDYDITTAEMAFAPVLLREEIAGARIGVGETTVPLVKETIVLNDVSTDNAILTSTPIYFHPTFLSWAFCLIVSGYIWWLAIKRNRYPRIAASIFFGLLGLAGLLLTFLIFVSIHEATSPNWNYLWVNPLAFVVPIMIWIKRCRKTLNEYFAINSVACLGALVVWCVGIQAPNPAFIPLVLLSLSFSASYLYAKPCQPNK